MIFIGKKKEKLRMSQVVGVFNGEIGTITKIDENERQIEILFDDNKIVWYQFSELDQIEHCYAITIHKAQRK